MKYKFTINSEKFVYWSIKNLESLKQYDIYEPIVYLVLTQEVMALNSIIGKISNNKILTLEEKDKKIKDAISSVMKHITYSSVKYNLEHHNIKIDKKYIELFDFLELTCNVISNQVIECGKHEKFIEIKNENENINLPNSFILSIPFQKKINTVKVDDKNNIENEEVIKEYKLVMTVIFYQDWLFNSIGTFAEKNINIVDKNDILKKYHKIIGSAYLAFPNKFGLNLQKLIDTFNKNSNNDNFLSESQEIFFKKYSKSDVLEYLKLYYVNGNISKVNYLYNKLNKNINDKLIINKLIPEEIMKKINNFDNIIIPDDIKEKILEKEDECGKTGDPKPKKWINTIKKIPFGIYKKDKIFSFVQEFLEDYGVNYKWSNFMDICKGIDTCNDKLIINKWYSHMENRNKKINDIKINLDKAVYGHTLVKNNILKLASEWANGNMHGTVIGIQGPPGNGKTSIVKNGICKAFVDQDENPFPYIYISLGSANSGGYLYGHGYTYQGSMHGQIIEGLIKAKCMNPIFIFDELDKISETDSGKELMNALIHITDFTQNDNFEDQYFAGIKFDISKCMFIFTFNDITKIDRILRDRLYIINTTSLNSMQKITIGRDYLMEDICKKIGWNKNDVILSNDVLSYIIKYYTCESGVRQLKRVLTDIVRHYNYEICNIKYTFPINIDINSVNNILDINNKIRIDKTHTEPIVGHVNGLYCIPEFGIGGTLPLQAKQTFPKESNSIGITVTGNLGKVMFESIECAKTTIWSLLSDKEKKDLKELENGLSIHLHAMDGSTPKEGPSAGAAITLCIYSLLTNKKVLHNLALTGEISLTGHIGVIGGVAEKVNGGHNAGCNIILLPLDNKKDFDLAKSKGCFEKEIRILENDEYSNDIVDNELCVKFVQNINDVIKMAII